MPYLKTFKLNYLKLDYNVNMNSSAFNSEQTLNTHNTNHIDNNNNKI